jgi:hypothetical protein
VHKLALSKWRAQAYTTNWGISLSPSKQSNAIHEIYKNEYRPYTATYRNLNDIFGQNVYFRDGLAFYCHTFFNQIKSFRKHGKFFEDSRDIGGGMLGFGSGWNSPKLLTS